MLMWYNIPYFISMGIPVGVLFAIFWIISRLSNDNEIIAIQTLGIPTKKNSYSFFVDSFNFVRNDFLAYRFCSTKCKL